MKEYIEREAAVAFLENMAASRYLIQCFENKDRFPAADVVEVVRCSRCKFCDFGYPKKEIGEEAIPAYWCWVRNARVNANDYCNYGKKMDGKGDTG